MSDHYHYDYADQSHGHSGYAADRHDHDNEYAERYHRHYDDESTAEGLREDLDHAETRIRELEDTVNAAIGRIARLEERLNSPAYEPDGTPDPIDGQGSDLD
jgi:hypothetical protein